MFSGYAIKLSHCFVVMLSHCFVVMLSCCHVVMLSCCHVVKSSHHRTIILLHLIFHFYHRLSFHPCGVGCHPSYPIPSHPHPLTLVPPPCVAGTCGWRCLRAWLPTTAGMGELRVPSCSPPRTRPPRWASSQTCPPPVTSPSLLMNLSDDLMI